MAEVSSLLFPELYCRVPQPCLITQEVLLVLGTSRNTRDNEMAKGQNKNKIGSDSQVSLPKARSHLGPCLFSLPGPPCSH